MATLDEVTRIRFEGREMYTELEGGMLEINVTKSKLASLIGGSLRCLGIGNTTHCSGMCYQSASFKTMVGAERESKLLPRQDQTLTNINVLSHEVLLRSQ